MFIIPCCCSERCAEFGTGSCAICQWYFWHSGSERYYWFDIVRSVLKVISYIFQRFRLCSWAISPKYYILCFYDWLLKIQPNMFNINTVSVQSKHATHARYTNLRRPTHHPGRVIMAHKYARNFSHVESVALCRVRFTNISLLSRVQTTTTIAAAAAATPPAMA